jgi:non-heme chloroperoxidase
MSKIKTDDGTEFKDWGTGQPIVFHHGWPLSADEWDNQLLFFLEKGLRVVAHDRRGHGRSSPSSSRNDMDTYAADVAALVSHLDLKNAIHVGHSTEAERRLEAVLIGAVPP